MTAPATLDPDITLDSDMWRRVSFSDTARAALAQAKRRLGRQAVILSWPSGAAYLPSDMYTPGAHDVVLGEVEDCPVYADSRQLALFRTRRVHLDAAPGSRWCSSPPLRARAARWA